MAKKQAGPIDCEVGRRIRERRLELGFNQGVIAKAAGVSYQQVGKYEDGTSRLAISQLVSIAQVLGVQPGQLLDSIAPLIASAGFADAEQKRYATRPAAADRLELERAFARVEDSSTRELIVRLTELLAKGEAES